MTVSADFQVEVNSLLMGDGTNYEIVDVHGLEDIIAKTADLDLLGDGEAPGVDRLGAHDIALTVEMYDATPSTLNTRWEAFKTAWALGATTTFTWQLSGAKRYVNGRTRGYTPDYSHRTFGIITVVGVFRATDPVVHT